MSVSIIDEDEAMIIYQSPGEIMIKMEHDFDEYYKFVIACGDNFFQNNILVTFNGFNCNHDNTLIMVRNELLSIIKIGKKKMKKIGNNDLAKILTRGKVEKLIKALMTNDEVRMKNLS